MSTSFRRNLFLILITSNKGWENPINFLFSSSQLFPLACFYSTNCIWLFHNEILRTQFRFHARQTSHENKNYYQRYLIRTSANCMNVIVKGDAVGFVAWIAPYESEIKNCNESCCCKQLENALVGLNHWSETKDNL